MDADEHGFAQIRRAELQFGFVLLQATAQQANPPLAGSFGVALVSHWGGFRVALGWL